MRTRYQMKVVWLHLFWSGRNSEKRREVGVGFALRNDAINKRTNLPKRFNDYLMTLRHHY